MGENCSVQSEQAGEALYGTAGKAAVYLLLEYPYPFSGKALQENNLPEAVQKWLNQAAKSIQDSKALLIRQMPLTTKETSPSKIAFFVGLARETHPVLYQFSVSRYEELLELDLSAILEERPVYNPYLRQEPLYLVCTNGKRDACCAKYGLPTYRAMQEVVGSQVWECSHIGGHRFATNVICLPHGLLYGRVAPHEVPILVEAYKKGDIWLERLRGRTIYNPAAQVGEFFLRHETGVSKLDAFRLASAVQSIDLDWKVTFEPFMDGQTHVLVISFVETGKIVYESCSMDKTTQLVRAGLVAHSKMMHNPME